MPPGPRDDVRWTATGQLAAYLRLDLLAVAPDVVVTPTVPRRTVNRGGTIGAARGCFSRHQPAAVNTASNLVSSYHPVAGVTFSSGADNRG